MNNTENITIALLLATAAILGAIVMASYTTETAYAGGVSVKQGDYVLATAQWSKSTDLVYVLDIAERRLAVYFLNPNTRGLEAVDSVDLAKAFRE